MTHLVLYPRVEVIVGGDSKTVLECTTMSGIRSPFATASARIRPAEGGFSETEDLRIALGYRSQASLRPRFGGRLIADSIRWAPKAVAFSGSGPLARTQEATGIVDESLAVIDPTLPLDYDKGTYALGWADATDGRIITDILALYGITDVNIVDTGRHFATLAPDAASKWAVKLASDQAGYDLIQQIDELTGCRTFDGPDGRVTRIVASGRPSANAARTFAEGVDFKGSEALREKSIEGLYNKVIVEGQSGIGPDGVPYSIHEETEGPSPFIPNPPGTRAYTLSSPLIETNEFAAAVATLLYQDKNWRRETVTLPLSYGDSSVYPGMTVAIDAPTSLDLDASSRFRVIEVRDTFGAQGYQTTIVCEGAGDAAAQGTTPNQPPIPVIDYAIEFEGLANGDVVAVVSLDGSASFDPDGTIALREWDGDPTAPTPIGDGTRAVVVYNPLPTDPPPTVGLTLTDNLGATATATRQIVAQGGNAYTRELWVAEGDQLAYTEDQVAWQEYPVAAVVIPEEAGDAAILAATSGGALHRVLLDGTDSTPAGPAGVTALAQTRDRNGTPTGACWAGASNGAIYRSFDDGVTWTAVAALPNGGACHAIAESPYQAGDVYAGGGNVLYHSFDNGGSWQAFYTHPNAAYVLTRFASGITADDQQVMWLGCSGPDAGTEPRVVERGGTLHHNFPPLTDAPYDITGLTISLDAARLFVTDSAGRVWTATTNGSEDLALRGAYDAGDLGTPRHAIRDGRFPVVWGAGDDATWKSTDEGGSFLKVRDHAARMVAYGRLRPAKRPISLVVVSAAGVDRMRGLWNGSGNDAPPPNWQTVAFLDGGWATGVAATYGAFVLPAGAGALWTADRGSAAHTGEAALLRRRFAVPDGTVRTATLTYTIDDTIQELYINGTAIAVTPGAIVPTAVDVASAILPGAENVLAIRAHDQAGGSVFIAYRLEIA